MFRKAILLVQEFLASLIKYVKGKVWKPCVFVRILQVLPPFLFTPRISFGQSQTTESLTKFILKNMNIYNTKTI